MKTQTISDPYVPTPDEQKEIEHAGVNAAFFGIYHLKDGLPSTVSNTFRISMAYNDMEKAMTKTEHDILDKHPGFKECKREVNNMWLFLSALTANTCFDALNNDHYYSRQGERFLILYQTLKAIDHRHDLLPENKADDGKPFVFPK